jgi:hypothetical protein
MVRHTEMTRNQFFHPHEASLDSHYSLGEEDPDSSGHGHSERGTLQAFFAFATGTNYQIQRHPWLTFSIEIIRKMGLIPSTNSLHKLFFSPVL